ncbi:hypothetical protein J6590_001840 [Homalodisca vitripennis]|nr:hypothetical protein J6590_001840 [Homalodisca vitripennis]
MAVQTRSIILIKSDSVSDKVGTCAISIFSHRPHIVFKQTSWCPFSSTDDAGRSRIIQQEPVLQPRQSAWADIQERSVDKTSARARGSRCRVVISVSEVEDMSPVKSCLFCTGRSRSSHPISSQPDSDR